MLDSEAYTLVTTSSHHQNFDDYTAVKSGKTYDLNVYLEVALRRQYPELALTNTVAGNAPLLAFAFAGHATATLDIVDESVLRTRYVYGTSLSESRTFAKYLYKWRGEYFIVYVVNISYYETRQYILKEPLEGETTMSSNGRTHELLRAIGKWRIPPPPGDKWVYIFDGYWYRSKALYEQVKNASWDDVILNEGMKKQITSLMHKFFDSRDIYKNLGVPRMSPCLLIFEDIDTIVTKNTRSYFFNEVDGLENNDGIFMVASTNHLDKLDAGLSSRPSRFDRKYLFPLPSEEERNLYCQFWRSKLKKKEVDVEFPAKICPAAALITDGFSFAYMQEAFVATLLAIALRRSDGDDDEETDKAEEGPAHGGDDGHNDLNDYELWRELKKTIKALRADMGDDGGKDKDKASSEDDAFREALDLEREAQAPTANFKPIEGQHTRPAKRGIGKQLEGLSLHRPRVQVDFQNVPLITEEGTFIPETSPIYGNDIQDGHQGIPMNTDEKRFA
ncbi:MAG: hypothetical protein Q9168_001669 [Polycauliona sp. 1 TL-2023]